MVINERIALLRKEKGVTQEVLANALGVTNQAVSKWESSICCPDILLLPEIAKFFGVTVDFLLGYDSNESKAAIQLKVKKMISALPSDEVFETVYKFASLLYGEISSEGFRNNFSKSNKGYTNNEFRKQEDCVYCFPQGSIVRCDNGFYFSNNNYHTPQSLVKQHKISIRLEKLLKPNVLHVLFTLYNLTVNDIDKYVSVNIIAEKANLQESEVEMALNEIPITLKERGNELLYRIEDSFMHIPSVLKMFCC